MLDRTVGRQGADAWASVESVTLEGRILRADGTTEDLGVLASWSKDESPSSTTTPGRVRFTHGD